MIILIFNVIKIFCLAAITSVLAYFWCPLLTNFLYKHQLWKKSARMKAISGEDAVVFNTLHKEKEVGTPRMGGLLVWVTVVLVIFLFFILSLIFPNTPLAQFNFLSRGQTWLPLFTLVVASIVGLIDDILVVKGWGKYIGGGISFKKRLLIVILIGLIGSIWFYQKLGWDVIYVPFVGDVSIGLWYIPLFILVTVACWSGGIIDGLDGLAGGTFASIFGAFTIISFSLGKIDLATFCAVITGALFAFLWFNIPPARFYMTETGILGLTTTLAVVAFLTDSVYVLPIIAGLLVIEVLSVIIQLLSKKIRKKKVFLSTPIHHHFEALGWPSYKVTMRAWIIGIVLAIVGVAVRLLR
ncbi:MAG: phospho-N-acetylmuramoyl-pentapeptide-transferase [Candidatus Staskawiczbacteria bacterium]|jgi:phospho-N-acetylmuramoyl-pentapeptide-transferase